MMNSSDLFRLKFSPAEHESVLKTALKLSTSGDPDICLVSQEGFRVYTFRSLLCLHSSLMSSLLSATADSCCCTQESISVPAPAASLHSLIQLLLEGSARIHHKKDVRRVIEAAKALGIYLDFIENNVKESQTFVTTFELKSKAASKEKISDVSSSFANLVSPETEAVMIKSEKPDNFLDTENNYSSNVRELSEVFVNDYADLSESEFGMPDIPMTSNAEIRAEMKIQSPRDAGHCSYECKFCKKVFANITHLKRHLPSHTGEKPFHCKLCGLKFSRKDNLLKHERTRCVVLRTAMEGTDIVYEDDISCSYGFKPYNCEVCGKGFIYKSRFKTHVESHISN